MRRLCGLERGGQRVPFGAVTREMLDRARAALAQDFAAVLLTEEFDRSLLLLSHLFNWEDVSYVVQNAGASNAQVELTPRAQELLEEHNRLDLELYQFARRRFRKDCERSGLTDAELESWRDENRDPSPLGRVLSVGRSRLRRFRRALGR